MFFRASQVVLRPTGGCLRRTLFAAGASSRNGPEKPMPVRPGNEGFEMIYRFPYIVGVKVLCRLKLFQTGITAALVPVSLWATHQGLVPAEVAVTTMVANLFALGMLSVMGEFFRKFVGIIYVNENTREAKVAHLTFFGNRKDVVVPLADLVPLSELPDNTNDIYVRLRRYSTKDVYYVSFRFGGLQNRDLFERSLGNPELVAKTSRK